MELLLKVIDDLNIHNQYNEEDIASIMSNLDDYTTDESMEHLFVLGDILMQLGHVQHAKTIFLKLHENTTHDDELVSYLVDILIVEGNIDGALNIVNKSPKTPATLLLKAELFQQLNMPEVSLNLLKEAKLLSDDSIIDFAIAEIHFYEGNIEEALDAYQIVLDQNEVINGIHIRLRIAELHMILSDFEKSIENYQKVDKELFTNKDLFNQAQVLKQLHQVKEASQLLKKVIDNEPYYTNAYLALIDIYESTQEYDEALVIAEQYLREDDENALFLNKLGTLYFKNHQTDKALEHLKKSIAIAPDYGDSYKHIFEILLLSSRTDEIESYIEDLDITDIDGDTVYLLAKIEQENENDEMALELYEYAYQMLNDSVVFLTDYYYFLMEIGSSERYKILNVLLERDPDNIEWIHEKERLTHEGYQE